MAQFASNADLAVRLGLALSVPEQQRADALLASASGLIQDEMKQTISLVPNEVFTRPGSFASRVRLPQRPVVSVTAVTLNALALVKGNDYYVDGDEIVRMRALPDTSFGLPNVGWGYPWQDLVVTYSHGYAAIPQLVKNVCMEMVTRVWTNPGAVIQTSIGNEQTVYAPYSAPPRGMMLTEDEKKELGKLLRRHSVSVALN